MRRIRSPGCACAASGHAAATPPRTARNPADASLPLRLRDDIVPAQTSTLIGAEFGFATAI